MVREGFPEKETLELRPKGEPALAMGGEVVPGRGDSKSKLPQG